MIDFEIKSKKQTVGSKKGQTVYYAYPKTQQKLTNKALVERIVRETSLSAGDVSNALISLSNVVCEALEQGMSVDLAELGSLRLIVPSKMMDSADDVTAAKALNTPKIQFTPKQKMREAANKVTLSIDRTVVTKADSGTSGDTSGSDTDTDTETGGGTGGNPLG
ncbi:MAG: HU family DNA-binding protein [Bacteroides sp.]|nr:HU family DNA-binding protein [Bacteroides sp.]